MFDAGEVRRLSTGLELMPPGVEIKDGRTVIDAATVFIRLPDGREIALSEALTGPPPDVVGEEPAPEELAAIAPFRQAGYDGPLTLHADGTASRAPK